MKKIKVILIGPISHIGGISVHIQRLAELLKNDFEFQIIESSEISISNNNYLKLRNLKQFFKVLNLISESDIVHVHCGNWVLRIYSILLASFLNKKIIVTIHSYRTTELIKKITSYFLKKVNLIIAVSSQIKLDLNIDSKRKIILKEAFIPVSLSSEKKLDPYIIKKIKKLKENNTFLICANASRLVSYKGKQLYGIDQCINVAYKAKSQMKNIHIIYIVATSLKSDSGHQKKYQQEIVKNNLCNYISIFFENISFVKLINECDLVIRPTLTDGDALTIREALWLEKNIIASDVVKRPKGTITYKNGDSDELFNKIIEVMNQDSNKVFNNSEYDYRDSYIKIYDYEK